MDTLDWQNAYEALTTDRIEATDTYIKVSPVPSVTKGRLIIEDNSPENYEIVHFNATDANGVFVDARDEDGNSTGVHARGVRVRMNITAQDLKEIRDYADTVISAYSALPTGTVAPFAGSTAPASYLLCDGAAISRTTYATLFGVIGTSFGIGDGTTTFNLPNLKGRSIFGYDSADADFNALGKTGGQKTVQAHTHTGTTSTGGAHTHTYTKSGQVVKNVVNGTDAPHGFHDTESTQTTSSSGSHNHTFTTASTGSGTNNLNPHAVMNFIIKT